MQGQRALLLALLLLTAVAGVFFLVLRPASTERGVRDDVSQASPVDPRSEVLSPTDVAPAVELVSSSKEVRQADVAPKAREAVSDGRRRIEVQVAFPEAAPPDSNLALVVLEASFFDDDENTFGMDKLTGGETRFPVGPNGVAEIVLPSDLEEPVVALDGQYLFLREPVPLQEDTKRVRLEAELGALLRVRFNETAASGDLFLTGADFSGQRPRFAMRKLSTAGETEVVFRAVDAELDWTLMPKLDGRYADMQMGLEFEYGETRDLPLALSAGAGIRGRVQDESGAPVAGAVVKTTSASPWMGNRDVVEVETSQDGSFFLEAIAPGQNELVAELENWITARTDILEVADGEVMEGVSLVLSRGATLSGRVQWPDGRPAEGASIVIEGLRERQGWGGFGGSRVRAVGKAKSDGEGRFSVSGLEEGIFTVRAEVESPDAGASAASDEKSTPVLWRASQENVPAAGADLLLTLGGPLRLRGRVVDDVGAPVTSFSIKVGAAENARFQENETYDSEDGTFVFARVGAGAWSVGVTAKGHVARSPAPEVSLPFEGEVELQMDRTASIAGRVVDANGAPVSGASVSRDGAGGQGNPWARRGGPTAETDASGAFLLEDLSPGPVALVAAAEQWADSLPLPLELAPAESVTDVVLAMRNGGRIEGIVVTPEGDPIASQRVTYGSNAMGFGSEDETLTDAVGRFFFAHVTPGEWSVSAAPSMAELGEKMRGKREPSAFIEAMGDLVTETVSVLDEETVEVFLGGEPKRPVRVFGRVTRGGSPVSGAQVVAVSENSAVFQGMKSVQSGSDGRYELTVDRPGGYVISAQLDKIGIEVPTDVPREDSVEVGLAIPEGRIEGTVRRPGGKLASRIRLSLQREDGLGRVRWNGGQATTDVEGRYVFEALEEGTYTVRANVGGWGGNADESYGAEIASGVEVDADAVTRGVDFKLQEAGSLRGVVRGPDGNPVDGASIFLRQEGGAPVSPISGIVTDAAGRFESEGVAPGRLLVTARASGFASAAAVPVQITSGEESDMELTLDAGTYILVTLEDENGALQRTRVEVIDEGGQDLAGLYSLQELQAIFNEGRSMTETRVGPFAPGRYTVRAVLADGQTEERRVRLRASAEDRKVRLKLK